MREWLKVLRKAKQMTHDTVADSAGISRVFYTNVENGERDPSVKVAKRIASVLGFDWQKFFED